MRVISGSAKGRSLRAVAGDSTRPTTDKVKESIFSMIGPYFEGGCVLDLFAGTGGLGIESLSRGMERAIFIDSNPESIKVVRQNLEQLGFAAQSETFCIDARRALKALAKRDIRFNLVFIDPPYRLNMIEELIGSLDSNSLLAEHATIVCEHGRNQTLSDSIGTLYLLKRTQYGDTIITIYQKRPPLTNHSEGESV